LGAEVRVNGKTYTLFKQVDGVRSVDTFASEIRLVLSEQQSNDSILKVDDLIQVSLDERKQFTGYMEKISDSESRDNHDVNFTARSKVADLIDSTVPDNVKSNEGVTKYADLIQLCIDGLGLTSTIKIIDNVGATFGDSQKLKSAETGQKVGNFLQENARIVQVFLNDDGDGNVVINRPGGKLKTILQNIPGAVNNNVKESTISIDMSKRYHAYRVFSNSSLASDSATVNDINNSGEAIDNEVRKTRVFEMIAKKPMSSDECKRSAEELANIARARSFTYTCGGIVGFTANNEKWEPGFLVSVKDQIKGVDGLFQINTVNWSATEGGDLVNLEITLPDKLTVEAEPTAVTERVSVRSSTYTVVKDDTLSEIAQSFNISLADIVQANPQIENIDLIFPDQQINIPER
jgi:prophage tail gpP-like protein